MTRSHLQALRALLKPWLRSAAAVESKHFFGGAAAYTNGRIFMTLTKVGLATPEERSASGAPAVRVGRNAKGCSVYDRQSCTGTRLVGGRWRTSTSRQEIF
jgi:hypothetical protein